MTKKEGRKPVVHAILAMAAIKDAVGGFDDGVTNVIDALDAVCVAIEAYRAASKRPRKAA